MIISKLSIRNFKRLDHIEFDLTSPLVLIGPNNSGKTSLLQALTLLEAGLKKIASERKTGTIRTGVSLNRKDLISIPVPSAKLLWSNKKVRTVEKRESGQKTQNINIEIIAEGYIDNQKWTAGLEFDYANDESIYCRALRKDAEGTERYDISKVAYGVRVAYLQPMSGLASSEDLLTPGSIDRKIGEGKTADIIRNICYQLLNPDRARDVGPKGQNELYWEEIQSVLKARFGIQINEPAYNPDNGLLTMTYTENNSEYDLSSAGRGFQQTLLLLCFLYSNPGRIILMDEPDAHLEVLRQREVYNLISSITRKLKSQLIIASHSEIVLDEAAGGQDQVIAVIGQNAINLNSPTLLKEAKKALTDIGWHKYYLAKLKKHVIYLEGSTDERNLIAFAEKLSHPVKVLLEESYIDPVEGNIPGEAYSRFKSLKLVEPELKGLALFDKLDKTLDPNAPLQVIQWTKREIENYFCFPEVFMSWAEASSRELFSQNYSEVMSDVISALYPPLYLSDRSNEWWSTEKMSEWTGRVFSEFYKRIGQPNDMGKGNFHELIKFLPIEKIDSEVVEKLDILQSVLMQQS